MSKTGEIEKIVLKVLEDGFWHNVSEMKNEIRKVKCALLTDENILSVVLYQMKTKKNLIEMKERGTYRLKRTKDGAKEKNDAIHIGASESSQNEDANTSFSVSDDMLCAWRVFYKEYMKNGAPSYEMSDEEFRRGKWLYQLNKKIEELIMSYKV